MRLLVLQHLTVEHPGVFRDFWREDGVAWTTVDFERDDTLPADLSAFDAMVVMGGPMDVWETGTYPWMAPEIAAIAAFVRLGKPYLGVCLGHQLLAAAMGAPVGLARGSEVGPGDVTLTDRGLADPLLAGLSSPLPVFQWHSAEVQALPRKGVDLAWSPISAIQAMRVGKRAYGLQFHAEITKDTVAEWRAIPAYAKALESALGLEGAARLEAETLWRLNAYRATARTLHRNFMRICRGG